MSTTIDGILAGIANAKNEFEQEKEALIKDYEAKIAEVKKAAEAELTALKDQLLAANIQAQVQRDVAESAHAARAAAERVTTSILTKFAVAESIFADMRNFATQIAGNAEPAARATNGLIHKAEAAVAAIPSEARDAVEEAKAAIEAALHKA